MSQDLLAAKSRALENSFFRERDLGLLAYLRSQTDQTRNQLAEISKIHDIKVLDDLIRVGITAGGCGDPRQRTSCHSSSRRVGGNLEGLDKLPTIERLAGRPSRSHTPRSVEGIRGRARQRA